MSASTRQVAPATTHAERRALWNHGDLTETMLLRARAGDREALEELLAALRPRVVSAMRRHLARCPVRDDLAEDIAQDTLIRVACHLVSCDAQSVGQLVAWAQVIARRRVLDERRLRLGPMDPARSSLPLPGTAVSHAECSATWSDEHIARSVSDETLLGAAFQAYDSLETSLTEIIWLRLVQRAGWREIAREVGTTPGAAKRRYQRAVDRMRRLALRRLTILPKPLEQLLSARRGARASIEDP